MSRHFAARVVNPVSALENSLGGVKFIRPVWTSLLACSNEMLDFGWEVEARKAKTGKPAREIGLCCIAAIYACLGEKDRAFEWLEKSCQEPEGPIFFIKRDPALATLRSDPRFADLVRRIGLKPP